MERTRDSLFPPLSAPESEGKSQHFQHFQFKFRRFWKISAGSRESQKFESKRTKIEDRILKKDNLERRHRASIFEIYRFPTAKD